MKKAAKIITGFGTVLLLLAGAGYGQENVKRVEGYKIDPPKAAKAMKSTGEAVAVAGYPIEVTSAGTAVAVPPGAIPQDELTTTRNSKLLFYGESKASEVKINVDGDCSRLRIFLSSNFQSGTISVELIDPKGENRGKYVLKSGDQAVTGDKTKVEEEVLGHLQKDFLRPIKGEWIIRALPVAAEGKIAAQIVMEHKPMSVSGEGFIEVIGEPVAVPPTPLPARKKR